jgi:hypothetical protein
VTPTAAAAPHLWFISGLSRRSRPSFIPISFPLSSLSSLSLSLPLSPPILLRVLHGSCFSQRHVYDRAGSCWTWATARAFSERLCQQSYYGVRAFPSPYLTENCFTSRGASKFVCVGGNSDIFVDSMRRKGSIPMAMYPGPPSYYTMPEEKQTKVPQNCEWSATTRGRSTVSGEPWMKIAAQGAHSAQAPPPGQSRESFIRSLQDELSMHGPVVLSLEMHDRAKCCAAGCPSEEQQDTCGRHAVVLHGWKTDPKTQQFFWIAQNAWGASKLPKWMSGVDTDRQGRTLYPDDRRGIRPNTFKEGTMVAFSYTAFVPDTDHYLASVSLQASVDSRAVRPLSVGEKFDSLKEKKIVRPLLPDCDRLSSHAVSSASAPKTKLGQLRAMFGGGNDVASPEHTEELDFDVTSCEMEASTIHIVKVTATIPEIKYGDSEGSLSLRLRLRPPHGHCAATKDIRSGGRALSLRGGCTKLSKKKCLAAYEKYAKCQWLYGPQWGGIGEEADDDKAGGESDVELRPRAVVVKDWVSVSQTSVRTKLFLPSVNPRTRFPTVQQLQVPLDYVTLELLGWSYESYNKPPSFFSSKAKASDVRANGEGASGQGAILRTVDVFLGEQYTDIRHACNPQSRIEHFCNGGQDRQCVRALGRHLDRSKMSVWTQAEKGGGGKKREWREEEVTIETMHAGSSGFVAVEGSCLHFASLDKCLPLCGVAVPTSLSAVKVRTGIFSKEERPCAGFRLPGGEKICLNDVSEGVQPSSENMLQRDRSQLMVCLATRWASLKFSPLPDKQHEAVGSSSGCVWSAEEK